MLCRGRGKKVGKALLLLLLLLLLLGAVPGEKDGRLAPGLRLPALLLLCQQRIHPCRHSQAVRCAKVVPLAAIPTAHSPLLPLFWHGKGGRRQGARLAPPPPCTSATKESACPSAPPLRCHSLRLLMRLCLLLLQLPRAGLRLRLRLPPPMRHGICAICQPLLLMHPGLLPLPAICCRVGRGRGCCGRCGGGQGLLAAAAKDSGKELLKDAGGGALKGGRGRGCSGGGVREGPLSVPILRVHWVESVLLLLLELQGTVLMGRWQVPCQTPSPTPHGRCQGYESTRLRVPCCKGKGRGAAALLCRLKG